MITIYNNANGNNIEELNLLCFYDLILGSFSHVSTLFDWSHPLLFSE